MKYIIITKKHLIFTLSLVLSVALVAVSAGLTVSAERLIPIYCVKRDDMKVALTFDAAWGNEDTGTLIEILGKYGVKATFFVVGEWVDKYPESVKQLSDAGHQVMNHSDSHPDMVKISKSQMLDQLNTCNDKIEAITGIRPNLFRAPYGSYNNTMMETVYSLGMQDIQWDVDSRDWKEEYTTEMIIDGVLKNVKSGSIVLFHNAAVNTPKALPTIIETLIERGYSFALVNDLIYTENYVIDHTGMQCKKESTQNISPESSAG